MSETFPRRLRRGIAALMLLAFLPVGSLGCFGKFQLTRNVYTFNTDVTADTWMRWFLFLVMLILPYPLAFTIDLLLANSIEFWTGDNPIDPTPGTRHSALAPDGSLVTLTFRAEGAVDVEVVAVDGTVTRLRVVREGSSLAARDAEGDLLARVANVDGRPAIVEGTALPGQPRLAAGWR